MPTVRFDTHLPDYEVLAELGRGNTRVLKARHLPTGDVVAIKQYAFATDAETLQRFARESQIMTRINHPNVVRVRDVQLGAALPYVVMDFVEGGDLRGLLQQAGHLAIPTTIRLGLQLTEAFRVMHPLHVVHRDVKPENVLYRRLVSGELHFLLTDFGIAKLRADDSTRTRTGQSLMTYEYAAPEQFDNPRNVDEAADYYALGAVLYECLTGHVPFVLHPENGLGGFMHQVLTAPVPPPVLPTGQPLPPSLYALLTGLLTRNPQHRLRDPNRVELLLEQGRVEWLQTSRAGGPVPPLPPANQTLTAPVGSFTTNTAEPGSNYVPVSSYETEVYDEPGWSHSTWWGIGGIGVAIALAAAIYIYSDRDVPTKTTPAIDSTMLMQPSTVPPIIDSTDDHLFDKPPVDEGSEQPETTPSTTPAPADPSSTVPTDSTGRMLPDSTE